MKRYLSLLLLCAGSLVSTAQLKGPSEKTLLWRISGKGLSKPSYLYGTMHMTDERLFNFSDSLLIAIEKSEGFAMEVDPDEMMTVVMEEAFNDIKKTKLLKDVISKKAYLKYAPLLSKKLKKKQDQITVKDVLQEQNKWMQEAYTKGSMPTFVDAWLYDIARKQGKWVGGVEDVQDQTGLLEDVFNEQDLEFLTLDYSDIGPKYMNAMVDTYTEQDIQKIDSWGGEENSQRKDRILLRRNVKMAYRMDSLSAVRTMVFAVGAAHLPGDSGVISLLRQKGFDVTPVFSNTKIKGKDYKVDAKPVPWHKVKDSQGLYEAEMPGKASALKMYGVLEMQMNINLFTSSGYMLMAFPAMQSLQNKDSSILDLARKMLQDEKVKQGVAITKDGMSGWEYKHDKENEYKRIQVYSSGQTLYVALAFFNKASGMEGEDAKHFFSSLKLFKAKETDSGFISFNGLVPGVVGSLPATLQATNALDGQMKDENFDAKVFMGIDSKVGAAYMLISKVTTNDKYIPDDSTYLVSIRENYKSKLDALVIDTLLLKDGIYSLEQKGIYKENNANFHGKSYIKGNRFYTLFAILPAGKQNEIVGDKVINEFNVSDAKPSVWSTQQGDNFTTWAPNIFTRPTAKTDDESETPIKYFNAKDTNTSYAFTIMRAPFDSTDWYNGQAAFWKAKISSLETYADTVISKQPFASNGLEGYDLEIKDRSIPLKSKLYRFFTYGDTLYTMFSYLPVSAVNDPTIRRFFNEIQFAKPAPKATIFISKAPEFIKRLSSTDSSSRQKTYEGISDANFIINDIPLLHNAMIQHYDWDSGDGYYSTLQTELGNKLVKIKDSTLADFIKSEYANQNGRDAEEQTSLLDFVVAEQSKANIRFVVDALKATDGNAIINESVLYSLNDSLELLQPFMPEVLTLLNKKNMVENVTSLAKSLMDSSLLTKTELLAYEPAILDFGKTKLKKINADKVGYGYPLSAVAVVAGKLNTVGSLALLQQMLVSKHNAVKMEAVYGLLEANKPIAANALLSIAADPSVRTELYDALKRNNKEALFPAIYKTQQYFAEAGLYEVVEEDDDAPTKATFVTMRKITLNGKMANAYFFKILLSSSEDKSPHLGVVAFPADVKQLEPITYGSNLLWQDAYTLAKQEKQIKELIADLKENTKAEE